MNGIILHVTYRGGQAKAFADEMLSSGLRAAVLAEDGCMQYDYYLALGEENCVMLLEHWRDAAALDKHHAGEPMAKILADRRGAKILSYSAVKTVRLFYRLPPFLLQNNYLPS